MSAHTLLNVKRCISAILLHLFGQRNSLHLKIFLGFLLYAPTAGAQNLLPPNTNYWKIDVVDEQKGMDARNVSSLIIDKNSLIWLGNDFGLKIFDNKRIYKASIFIPSEKAILDMPVQEIWYNSKEHYLLVFASSKNKIVLYTLDISKLNSDEKALEVLCTISGENNQRPHFIHNNVISLIDKHISVIQVKDRKFCSFKQYKGFHSYFIWSMKGIYYADNEDKGLLYKFSFNKDNAQLNFEGFITNGAVQELCFGSGSVRVQNRLLINENLVHPVDSFGELRHDPFWKYLISQYNLKKDHFGNYYSYGGFGLQKISQSTKIIDGCPLPNETRSILVDERLKQCYIATARGICPFNLEKGTFGPAVEGSSGFYCFAGVQNDSQFIFVTSTLVYSLLIINKKTGLLSRIANDGNDLAVYDTYLEDGHLYLCTNKGLRIGRIENNRYKTKAVFPELKDELKAILPFEKGRFFVVGAKGLYIIDIDKHQVKKLFQGDFLCLCKAGANFIAGTRGSGALLFDKEGKQLQRITTGNGMNLDIIYSILYDATTNAAWFGTSWGLTVYHLQTGMHKTFTTKDGMPNNELNMNSAYQYKDKNLMMMGGLTGISLIQNRKPFLLSNPPLPIPWAYEVVYNNANKEEVIINHQAQKISHFQPEINRLLIKLPGTVQDKIYATAYKIDEEDWQYKNGGEDLELISPTAGKHSIQFKSILANGQESDIISIHFKVGQVWYKGYLGLLVLVLSILLLLLPIWLARERFLNLKTKALISKQREKMFALIAHDLRNPMKTYQGMADIISYLIENKDWEGLKKVSQEIDKTGRHLDLMLENLLHWSLLQQKEIKPLLQKTKLEEIGNSLVDLYAMMAQKKGLHFSFQHELHQELFTDINLINLIVRNLLDNAVKNAPSGSQINCSIKENKEQLLIETDNAYDPKKLDKIKKIAQAIQLGEENPERGIGIKFIIQAANLLQGTVSLSIQENDSRIHFTISIPIKQKL